MFSGADKGCIENECVKKVVKGNCQIWLVILSKYERINQVPSPLKSSENLGNIRSWLLWRYLTTLYSLRYFSVVSEEMEALVEFRLRKSSWRKKLINSKCVASTVQNLHFFLISRMSKGISVYRLIFSQCLCSLLMSCKGFQHVKHFIGFCNQVFLLTSII